MPTINVNADELIRKFTKLSQFKNLTKSLKTAAGYVKNKIEQYPSTGNKPPQGWASKRWTDKQRRWFWANFKKGNLKLPYRRTNELRSGWRIRTAKGGFSVSVSNPVKHGKYTQSPKKQTAYHAQTGWKTTTQVANEERDTVIEYIEQGIMRDLEGA